VRTLAKGLAGRLLVGYLPAARLGAWELAVPDDRFLDGAWELTATVKSADAYWLEHSPSFCLELDVGPQRWRWPAVRVEAGGRALTVAGQGPPEVRIDA